MSIKKNSDDRFSWNRVLKYVRNAKLEIEFSGYLGQIF